MDSRNCILFFTSFNLISYLPISKTLSHNSCIEFLFFTRYSKIILIFIFLHFFFESFPIIEILDIFEYLITKIRIPRYKEIPYNSQRFSTI